MWTTPTHRTAMIAGIWSATGLAACEAWIDQARFTSVPLYNLAWISAAAVFFVVPTLIFVTGLNTGTLSRTWFLDPRERAAYWIVVKRMLVWFISAGATGALIAAASRIFSTISPQ